MLCSQLRQHLTVEADIFFLQQVDKLRVAQAVRPDRGVDSDLPQRPVSSFFFLAAAVGVNAGFDDGGLSQFDRVLAAPAETLGLGEQSLAFGNVCFSSFNSRHRLGL